MGRTWASIALVLVVAVTLVAPVPEPVAALSVGDVTFHHNDIAVPEGIAVGADGNLWFTSWAGDAIGRMTPSGAVTTFTDPDITHPHAIVAGPDGNLWFTLDGAARIGRISPDGNVDVFIDADIDAPSGLAVGADGNLWFANGVHDSIARITPGGEVTAFTDPEIDDVVDVVDGPDGNIWFIRAGTDPDVVGRITPDGAVTAFRGQAIDDPTALAAGPDGNVWFTSASHGTIARITPAGVTTEFDGPAIARPGAIAAGPDGALWFTDDADGAIGAITTSGEATLIRSAGIERASALVAGPGGAMWFTDAGLGSLGALDPSGGLVSHIGMGISNPGDIVLGPDGAQWFISTGIDAIGRIDAAGETTMHRGAGIDDPHSLAVGDDGNLWFTNASTSTVGRLTTSGVVTTFGGFGGGAPQGIASGADGSLWFTIDAGTGADAGDGIGRVTPGGTVSVFTDETIHDPLDIVRGADGDLWFTNAGGGSIGSISTTGVVAEHLVALDPVRIAAGPNDDLWFTSQTEGIGSVTIDGVAATRHHGFAAPASDLAVGPDGNIWVTLASEPVIAVMDADGLVTAHTDERIGSAQAIAAGGAGAMWFTDAGRDAIGRIVATATPVVPAKPLAVRATPGDGSAEVRWSAPVHDGGAPITTYTVTAAPDGATCHSAGTSCTVVGLANGVDHSFTVTATNAAGTSPPSTTTATARPTGCAPGGSGPFVDVPPSNAFCADVEWLVGSGAAAGFADGTFRPSAPVSRQAFAAFFSRYWGGVAFTPPETPTFSDVPVGSAFYTAVEWMAAAGAQGYADGTYRPTAPVSRQAFASFLVGDSTCGPLPVVPTYADVPLGHRFFSQIEVLAQIGVAGGYADGTFRPGAAVSRQAMAAFIRRFDQFLVDLC